MSAHISNVRPEFDREIVDIVDYVMNYAITSTVAYDTAHYCLLDTLGCGLEALEYPACKTAGADCPGDGGAERCSRAGHPVSARPGAGSV